MKIPSTQLCIFVVPPGLPCVAFCEAGTSTTVESALQINPFMQNKANLPDAQMNVSDTITKDYENKTLGRSGKNKPNSKPNKANLLKAQMNVTSILTKDYENISNCSLDENKANSNPIKANSKPIKANKMPKQTQFKPNQTQFQYIPCPQRTKKNYLPTALFPLTSPASRDYNGIFSQISCFRRQMKGFGNG